MSAHFCMNENMLNGNNTGLTGDLHKVTNYCMNVNRNNSVFKLLIFDIFIDFSVVLDSSN